MLNQDELVDNPCVRGSILLSHIYQIWNVEILERVGYYNEKQYPKQRVSMQKELAMIDRNHIWKLVNKLNNKNFITVNWVFRTKKIAYESTNKLKSMLVVKAYNQIFAGEFFDTFSLVARQDTIRMLLDNATENGWKT